MPKYYFDIKKNDHVTVDYEGTDLPGDHDAHRQAIRTIAELASQEIPRDGSLKLAVGVANQDHHLLHRVHVTFEPGA